MSARAAVSKLVTASVAPVLRAAGFRKQALTFERRRGDVTQLVNVQVSHGGSSFYVNVGLIFDAVQDLGADETGSVVLGKHVVHHASRLHELLPALPAQWDAGDATAGDQVARALGRVLPTLERIDGPAAMLDELALDAGFEKVLRAQLKWIVKERFLCLECRADLGAEARVLAAASVGRCPHCGHAIAAAIAAPG